MKKNLFSALIVTAMYGLMPLSTQAQAYAQYQPAVYPQQQAQVGAARLTQQGDTLTLANDLFAASFVQQDGTLHFAGSEALGLKGGTELFTLRLGEGGSKTFTASQLILDSLRTVPLTGSDSAVRGSAHYDGQSIEAYFHGQNGTQKFSVLWSAVLRDGSHYLRTTLRLTTSTGLRTYALLPLQYEVDAAVAGTPAVVGNTRGAVLASDRLFAGLETPMGINSVSGINDNSPYSDYASWTENSFSWTPAEALPTGVKSLGFNDSQVVGRKGWLTFKQSGRHTVTFQYQSGTHRLNIVGMDLVNAEGKVVAKDYHVGYTGEKKSQNVYTLQVPEAGAYLVRTFIETRTETITSSGSVTFAPAVQVTSSEEIAALTGASGEPTIGIQGLWSRNTSLKKGSHWDVSAVVGVLAPSEERRSLLAYIERERAVPWRCVPMYNSWFELNINRNNDANYASNMTIEQCVDVLKQWKTHMYDRHGISLHSFVWDDGWDFYGTWTFNTHFPNGFKEADEVARQMGSGIGAWLGPVGGYGQSGNYRRNYWNNNGGMQLSNQKYYDTFLKACSQMITDYDFRYFKFDGISAQFSAVGPDSGTTGEENAEGIISIEKYIRENLREDIFFNTTVGTWASPFWFNYSDAVWRQENDYGTAGKNSNSREQWITYRDQLVYKNFVTLSPLCPINTLMTHGFILSKHGGSGDRTYKNILNELRCAFACGSGMVEIYADYTLMNSINGGKLWDDLAECIRWQESQKEVLADIHWVGGAPWDGSKENVYGWASWNGSRGTLALRNGSSTQKTYTFTLRKALDVPARTDGAAVLTPAFASQAALKGVTAGQEVTMDQTLTVTLPASSVYVFNVTMSGDNPEVNVESMVADDDAQEAASAVHYDLSGRRVDAPTPGIYITQGKKRWIRER